MGTNYYLRIKTEFNPLHRLPAAVGCLEGQNEPIELINGWVWNNKYYVTLESLNSEYYQEVHIGKSAGGWRFLLCQYPEENPQYKDLDECFREKYLTAPILCLADWVNLFNNPSNVIVDEYDNIISADDMLKIITERKPHEGLIEGWQKVNKGTPFESRDEYRAIDGLLVHDRTREMAIRPGCPLTRPNYITVMPRGFTYDLVLSGNDAETGEIFC